jgi:uncharacterized protein
VFALPRRRTHPTSGRSPDSRIIRLAAFPNRCESLHLKRLNFTVSGIVASPPRSQWRGRAGFSPASLSSFYKSTKSELLILNTRVEGKSQGVSSSAFGSRSSAKLPRRKMAYMISPDLLEILVCPACKKPLVQKEDGSSLKCGECRRVYPVRDDIPILLVDEATVETA